MADNANPLRITQADLDRAERESARQVTRTARRHTSKLSAFDRQRFTAVGVGRVLSLAVDEFIDRIDNLHEGRPRAITGGRIVDTPGELALEMTDTLRGWIDSVVDELMELEKLDTVPKGAVS